MNLEKSIFQNVLTFLPLFTGFLILMGFCYLSSYYDEFGIRILNYLEFSEIILSFLYQILLLIVAGVIAYIVAIMIQNTHAQLTPGWLIKNPAYQRLIKQPKSPENIIKLYYLLYKRPFIIFSESLLLIVFAKILLTDFTWMSILRNIAFGFLGLAATIYVLESSRKDGAFDEKSLISKAVILIMLLFLYMVYHVGQLEAEKVIKNKGIYHTSLIFDDGKSFHSTGTRYFIGQTKNYFFIYDDAKKSTEVIPMSEIKRIITEVKNTK